MTWYLFIIAGIIATTLAYRKKQAISRMGIEETNLLERFFGTDFGMICCACVTLAIVLGFILKADPTIPQLKLKEESQELKTFFALGERLASKVKSKANGGKALIITRAPNDESKKQHERLLEGIKAGLGTVKVGEVIFAESLSSGKKPDEQALPFRLSNAFLNQALQQHADCSVVISTVGMSENFVESNLAADITSKKRAFAVYTDNVYMQINAMDKSRVLAFNYCVFPSPAYDSTKPAPEGEFDFDKRFVEMDMDKKNRKQRDGVLKKHRRMFFYPKRQIVKKTSSK